MTTVALGEVVDFYSGGTPSKANPAFWKGDVPWFSAKDIKQPRLSDSVDHVAEAAFESTSLRKLPAGTVAMVVRGMILAHTVPVAILDVEASINQDLKALLPRREIDSSFLAAMLRAQHDVILGQVSTAAHGTKKLDARVLENIQIPLPPIDEQRRIAAILEHADELRSKRRKALLHLDDLTDSIFFHMFGRSEFELETVESTGEVQGGLQVTARRKSLPLAAPYLRVANVFRNRLDLGEVKTLRVTERELERTRLRKGDILVVEGHGNPNEIGRAAIWTGAVDDCVHQNHLIRVRFNEQRVLPRFGVFWMNSREGRSHLLRSAKTTSGLNTISTADVKSIPIPVVPLEAQLEFVSAVDAALELAGVCRGEGAEMDTLFQSLTATAFAGRL